MTMAGVMLIVFAVVGLLMAHNTGRAPISTWRWLPPSREERPQLFANFVSANIGLMIAGFMAILLGFLS